MFNRVSSDGYLQNDDISFLLPKVSHPDLPLELRELYQEYSLDSCQQWEDAAAVRSSDWPISIFVPEKYEENYAYPLVIWFHDEGSSEAELESVLPAISSQNYCGLALRGNQPHASSGEFTWAKDPFALGQVSLADLVNLTARRLRRAFHIHSERIFIAGAGKGADVALQLLSEHSEWFAGAVLLDPECAPHSLRPMHPQATRDCSVLLTVSQEESNTVLAQNVDAVRLLRAAGVEVDVRVTGKKIDPAGRDTRFIDNWLLSKIRAETYI